MKTYINKAVLLILLMIFWKNSFAQNVNSGVIFHIQSSHTSFPDTGRTNGHTYDKVLYTAAEHYHDSTVLIIAPKNLDAKKTVDLVFWFHGWRNSVDNAASYYELTKQFIASKKNAVLVLAETAKDSPDSYGGKLENPGVFKGLTQDVLNGLKGQHLIPKGCKAGHILLAGHSGAYRVMARIIKNGQMPIDEVILFDALYAETPIFLDWIKADNTHRFIDLYTDHGGTDEETHNMVKLIAQEHIPYLESEEGNINFQSILDNRLIFIHSLHEHNNVINNPDNFRLFLENSAFLKSLE
ncbi:MAG TPA: hypothetical protein VK671_03140 [Mucilaginibacter sp.]|jgi:hypothetical protein|nr:hypothetical protein [Mucilaginibacter sp.]